MNIAQRTVRKRVDLGLLGGIFGNSAQAGKSVDTVNVHGTRTTDTLSARSSESKSRVELILDLDLQTQKKSVLGSRTRSTCELHVKETNIRTKASSIIGPH